MPKIKCPGCGADIDTDSGRAEYRAPDVPADVEHKTEGVPLAEPPAPYPTHNTSRFWRRDD